MELKKFPVGESEYDVKEVIGYGGTSIVHRGICLSNEEEVAIKMIDLDASQLGIETLRKELQQMSMLSHPNVVILYNSFVEAKQLWMITEYLSGGSCSNILKYKHKRGIKDESIIGAILYQTILALEYMHSTGRIHRDIKAGNILIAADGTVKVSDFGVSASFFEDGKRKDKRLTFVGTPCWMAPEVLAQSGGYDASADIWSLGITALELIRGRAPYSNLSHMKAVIKILEGSPPSPKEGSRQFKDMVSCCLQKDPTKRHTAVKLYKHKFFSGFVKNPDSAKKIIISNLLDSLPPLKKRVEKTNSEHDIHSFMKKIESAPDDIWNFDLPTNDGNDKKKKKKEKKVNEKKGKKGDDKENGNDKEEEEEEDDDDDDENEKTEIKPGSQIGRFTVVAKGKRSGSVVKRPVELVSKKDKNKKGEKDKETEKEKNKGGDKSPNSKDSSKVEKIGRFRVTSTGS